MEYSQNCCFWTKDENVYIMKKDPSKKEKSKSKVGIIQFGPFKDIMYFEITILKASTNNPSIGIGFAPVNEWKLGMPGWYDGSIGYHGDDGGVFDDIQRYKVKLETYGPGDTVGAYWNTIINQGFFTKNGKKLDGYSFIRSVSFHGKMLPTVGFLIDCGDQITINYGSSPFKYEISKENIQDEKKEITKKEFDELKQFLLLKINELKKDHENEVNLIKNIHEKQIKEMKKKINENNSIYEKDKKELRYQLLTEMIFIKDEDLKINLPLKKKNCFLVKDIQKARDLGGIISMKDLERVIENDDYQDIFEIKNTINCLEGVVEEWKNGKLKLDDLDQALELKIDFDEWKSKESSQLAESILNNFEKDDFKDFQISQRIEKESIKLIKTMKDKPLELVQKIVIESVIKEWKMNNLYDNEMKEFIKIVPIDKTSKIQEMKSKFKWEMIPKWNQRREKLLKMLAIHTPNKSKFDGLLIIDSK